MRPVLHVIAAQGFLPRHEAAISFSFTRIAATVKHSPAGHDDKGLFLA
jgi:hypothetical protein